ncbi:MAG TPA: SRPBCC family protein [Solirubrobacterales bacterium]|nr:SRPBCC family protein [Solirubrobacterales bacterium]
MGPIQAEVEIDAPRERIFELVGDLSLRPSFTDHFLTGQRLTRLNASGVGAGARFRVKMPLRSPWEDTAIVEQAENTRVVEQGAGGRVNRIRTHTVWELSGGSGGQTRLTVTHWTEPANPLDAMLEKLSGAAYWQRRGWNEALRRLREAIENDLPAGERIAVAGGNRYATGIP